MYNRQLIAIRRKAALVIRFAKGQCSYISVHIVRATGIKKFNGTFLSIISVNTNTYYRIYLEQFLNNIEGFNRCFV